MVSVTAPPATESRLAAFNRVLLKLSGEALNAGRPADKLDQIAEGRLRKWYEEVVLLEQPYFRDEKLKVEEVRAALARETGENIQVARFASYVVGGS